MLLPSGPQQRGGRWADHRTVINGIFFRTRAGCPWRDLPEGFGNWKTIYNRHRRWSLDGTWERLLPLAQRLGVPILTGTDTAGTIAREVALLAEHGLEPAAALKAATTTGYRFLGEPFDQAGQPATLVTYQNDPREDLAILSSPIAIIIDGVRVR